MSSPTLFDSLVNARVKQDAHQRVGSDHDWTKYPTLMQFLTRVDAGNGYTKEPASITVKNVCGTFQVELTDPSLEVAVLASSPTLDEAVASLEATLASPNPPIRSWRGATGKLKKKNEKGT